MYVHKWLVAQYFCTVQQPGVHVRVTANDEDGCFLWLMNISGPFTVYVLCICILLR